jgi:hypothetical protein
MGLKKCTICKTDKSLSLFSKDKSRGDGLSPKCKQCCILKNNQFKSQNPQYHSQWYLNNKDKVIETSYVWRENNKEKWDSYVIEYNKTVSKEKVKQWMKDNNYHMKKYYSNPNERLHKALSSAILKSVKNVGVVKNQPTLEIIGLKSWDIFKEYIENQFEPNMTWDNHGIGKNNTTWHIDHIKPISLATTLEEVKKLNHYTNLKPMWGSDNIRKSNKVII